MKMYTIEEWKEEDRRIPSGVCECAGCNRRLRKRKHAIKHYKTLEEHEQPYKYCIVCLCAGHDMVFPRKYEQVIINEKVRYGKRLPSTSEMIEIGKNTQRRMHE